MSSSGVSFIQKLLFGDYFDIIKFNVGNYRLFWEYLLSKPGADGKRQKEHLCDRF